MYIVGMAMTANNSALQWDLRGLILFACVVARKKRYSLPELS